MVSLNSFLNRTLAGRSFKWRQYIYIDCVCVLIVQTSIEDVRTRKGFNNDHLMYQRTVLKWRLSCAVEKQYNYGESETLIFSLNIFLIDYEINEKK